MNRASQGPAAGRGTRKPTERSDVWTAIDDQRRALVRLLEDLSEEEWRQPSLCDGWTIRQVAAHLALQNTTWSAMPRTVLSIIGHGGMNSAIHAMACRHAELPVEVIVGEICDRIQVWRPLPTLTFRETAIDYLVHGQDIAIPLGRSLQMPPGLATVAADRVWNSPGCSRPARSWLAAGSWPTTLRGRPGKAMRSPARSARCSCSSPAGQPHSETCRAREPRACASSARPRPQPDSFQRPRCPYRCHS
jgi:uncharacterized protein (TIGR03083 family)